MIVVRSAARIDWLVFSARPGDGDIEVRDVAGDLLFFRSLFRSRSPIFKIHDRQTAELTDIGFPEKV